jgi:hypothetical protein
MKTTFFLMNIQDESLTSIKTICQSDPTIASFNKEIVQKIKAKAKAKAMDTLEDSQIGVCKCKGFMKKIYFI